MREAPPPMWAITADHDVFTVVRDWTRDSIRPVRAPAGLPRTRGTLLVKTPDPWATGVASAALVKGELRPLLVLKNAVALWAVHRDLPDGQVTPEDWQWFRRLCLLHNPGLDGALSVIDAAIERPERSGGRGPVAEGRHGSRGLLEVAGHRKRNHHRRWTR